MSNDLDQPRGTSNFEISSEMFTCLEPWFADLDGVDPDQDPDPTFEKHPDPTLKKRFPDPDPILCQPNIFACLSISKSM